MLKMMVRRKGKERDIPSRKGLENTTEGGERRATIERRSREMLDVDTTRYNSRAS